jgi:hypothetical protein
MIQRIKILHPEFQLDSLRDRSGLGKRNVEISNARTAKYVTGQTIGAAPRIVHRINLRETGIRSSKVGGVLQRNIGKAVGIEKEVAGDRSRCNYTLCASNVLTGRDLIDRTPLPGIERAGSPAPEEPGLAGSLLKGSFAPISNGNPVRQVTIG